MIVYNHEERVIELEIEDSLLEAACPYECTPYPPDPWEVEELISEGEEPIDEMWQFYPIGLMCPFGMLIPPWTVRRKGEYIKGALGYVMIGGDPCGVWFVDYLVPGWRTR